jgi:flagellar motility protein MotE (MotC chaperone)
MIRYIRDLRLIPIALIASVCLLTLKIADIAVHGSSFFARNNAVPESGDVAVVRSAADAAVQSGSSSSWAQQMFNFPGGSDAAPASLPAMAPIVPPQIATRDNVDITGSVSAAPEAKAAADAGSGAQLPAGKTAKPAAAPPSPGGIVIPTDGVALPSGAERAILERLQQRRQELETRGQELDLRESLIQAAEKRMDAKLVELKEVEAQIKAETQQKNDAEKARLKGLVTMYEAMKPRDAAKIFDGLDPNVLLEVAAQINPRTMADIAAQMSPEVAQRLTVELADKAQRQKAGGDAGAANLPKIQGQSTTP